MIYVAYAMDFFLKASYAPLNIKNIIILTEKEKEILERRRKRKEAELKEKLEIDYKKQEEEERRWQKEKQNEILGAVAEYKFSSQLNKNDKVYVKGHYRNKQKRKRR